MSIKLGKKMRRAAVAVELAVVTPVLLTMLFGIVEFGWIFTVQQGVTTAAREGARAAVLPGATVADVESRVADYTQPLGLTGYVTTVACGDDGSPSGTVTVSIPYANVTLVGDYFDFCLDNLTATCSMRKETVD